MDQFQCPNCQGYKVDDHTGCADMYLLHVCLTFLTVGMWLLVWIPMFIIDALRNNGKPRVHSLKCLICGYSWEWTEGTPYPRSTRGFPFRKKAD